MIAEKILSRIENIGKKEILKTRNRSWNAEEFYEETIRFKKKFDGHDLQTGEPVGLSFPNSGEFVFSMLGLELGGHPVILLGSYLKPREIRYHVESSRIRFIFAHPGLSAYMKEAGGIRTDTNDDAVICWRFSHDADIIGFEKGDYICQMTSGTGGRSKCAVRSADAVLKEIESLSKSVDISQDDITLTIPPLHHSFGLIPGTLLSLISGAKVILLDGFMPGEAIRLISDEKVTAFFAVPFMYKLMTETIERNDTCFDSLKHCVTAGAAIGLDTAEAFEKRFGRDISVIYGATETGVMCFNSGINEKPLSVGKPIYDREMKISFENENDGHDKGLIWTKSTANSRAYLYPEEMNKEAFQNGWYNTNDLGSIDEDGYVYVSGRKNAMINVSGMKVDPQEVEMIISGLEGINEVAVVGIDNSNGSQIIKAVVVKASHDIIDIKKIIDHCKKNLSDYKVPRVVEFRNELPKSQTGKILRQYLLMNESELNGA